ncbi:hypothetical protein CR983_00780 [Candidatus Saccharibacteria bacterium]|nr:MAG: hypothetical protein CR983_00780 [Candidatus Saccharibacteria bacterium]
MSHPTTDDVRLGAAAEGSIAPSQAHHAQFADTKAKVLEGAFHRPTPSPVVSGCIDGRCGGQSRASSAGGTISLMVAADLTRGGADERVATADMLRQTIERLHDRHLPIGDHDDDHTAGEKTGCGANDNLAKIYRVIAEKGDSIRDLARRLGFGELVADDAVCRAIEQAAARRSTFSTPADLTRVLLDTPDAVVDTLHGEHNEAMIVINRRPDTTLDHQAMADAIGSEEFEAFDVDAWAFEDSARAVADDPDDSAEVSAKTTALLYYNLATALALCGPEMPIVTLR